MNILKNLIWGLRAFGAPLRYGFAPLIPRRHGVRFAHFLPASVLPLRGSPPHR